MTDSHESVPFVMDPEIELVLRNLIREVKGLELEAGRNLAFEELRTLRIAPHLIEVVARSAGEHLYDLPPCGICQASRSLSIRLPTKTLPSAFSNMIPAQAR